MGFFLSFMEWSYDYLRAIDLIVEILHTNQPRNPVIFPSEWMGNALKSNGKPSEFLFPKASKWESRVLIR